MLDRRVRALVRPARRGAMRVEASIDGVPPAEERLAKLARLLFCVAGAAVLVQLAEVAPNEAVEEVLRS